MATFVATRQAHAAAYGSTVRQRTYVRASASCATSSASVRSPSSRNATRYAGAVSSRTPRRSSPPGPLAARRVGLLTHDRARALTRPQPTLSLTSMTRPSAVAWTSSPSGVSDGGGDLDAERQVLHRQRERRPRRRARPQRRRERRGADGRRSTFDTVTRTEVGVVRTVGVPSTSTWPAPGTPNVDTTYGLPSRTTMRMLPGRRERNVPRSPYVIVIVASPSRTGTAPTRPLSASLMSTSTPSSVASMRSMVSPSRSRSRTVTSTWRNSPADRLGEEREAVERHVPGPRAAPRAGGSGGRSRCPRRPSAPKSASASSPVRIARKISRRFIAAPYGGQPTSRRAAAYATGAATTSGSRTARGRRAAARRSSVASASTRSTARSAAAAASAVTAPTSGAGRGGQRRPRAAEDRAERGARCDGEQQAEPAALRRRDEARPERDEVARATRNERHRGAEDGGRGDRPAGLGAGRQQVRAEHHEHHRRHGAGQRLDDAFAVRPEQLQRQRRHERERHHRHRARDVLAVAADGQHVGGGRAEQHDDGRALGAVDVGDARARPASRSPATPAARARARCCRSRRRRPARPRPTATPPRAPPRAAAAGRPSRSRVDPLRSAARVPSSARRWRPIRSSSSGVAPDSACPKPGTTHSSLGSSGRGR